MSSTSFPSRGSVFWPVGTGDSTTIVIDEQTVMQVDLHDMAKADDEENPEIPVIDFLVDSLPVVDGRPYLAVFALTHADKDHCLGFEDLLSKVRIGELWATPRLWREFNDSDADGLCSDAKAFQAESERRVEAIKTAIAKGDEPESGDRIIVIGYDSANSEHAYSELPSRFKSGPGKIITALDWRECSEVFQAFIHAPFADDAAAPRNETSLAMQITLKHESGADGKLLLLGDLAHDTLMKVFDYSEYHKRDEYVAWDLLLAPHHCSKRVMYKLEDDKEVLQMDILNAFERHQRDGAVVVSSSAPFPDKDVAGNNPPHRMAADRYSEITNEVICTMTWLDVNMPSPVVFGVDANGGAIVRDVLVEEQVAFSSTQNDHPTRLTAVTTAATRAAEIAKALYQGHSGPTQTGADRVAAAIDTDRGGEGAPTVAVGFGQ